MPTPDQKARAHHLLVIDIGGGTSDFSLFEFRSDGRGPVPDIRRVAVSEHILLGGDNMDLALAYALQAKLEAAGKTLDSWQFLALVHAASKAKITLFEDKTLAEAPIAVPSTEGSRSWRPSVLDTDVRAPGNARHAGAPNTHDIVKEAGKSAVEARYVPG